MNWKLALVLGAAVSALAGCGSRATPEERLAHASQLVASGDYAKAQTELSELVADGKDSAQARVLLARASYALGDLAGVELNVAEATAQGAASPELTELLARTYLGTGRFAEAHTLVANAGKQFDDGLSRLLQAEALIGMRDFARALETIGPVSVDSAVPVRAMRASALIGAGEFKVARTELDELLAANPGHPGASLMLAQIHLRENDLQAADKVIETALLARRPGAVADPSRMQLLQVRAEIALADGKVDRATEAFSELKTIAPDARGTHILSSRLAMAANKFEDAASELRPLIQRDPNDTYVRFLLAVALANARSYNQAEQQLSYILSSNPEHTQARLALARLQLTQGRLDAAQAILEEGGTGPEDSALLGQIKLRLGDSATAIDLLRSSLAAKPDDASRALDLAEAYLLAGDAQQAADAMSKVTTVPEAQRVRFQHMQLLVHVLRSGGNAVSAIEDMVTKGAGDVTLRLLAAGVYMNMLDQPEAARRHLLEAQRRAPSDARVLVAMARLESATGNFDAARAALLEVLKVDKDNVGAIAGLAWLAVRREDLAELATWRTQLNQLSGPRVRIEALRLSLLQKDVLGAERAEKAIFADIGDAAIANYAVGSVYLDVGQVEAARGRLRKAAEARPDVPEYWLRLGQAEGALGEPAAAEKSFNQALVARRDWLPAARLMVRASLEQKNTERAMSLVAGLRERHPEDLAILVLDADTRAAAGRAAEAAALYETAYGRRPDQSLLARWVSVRRAAGVPSPEKPLQARLAQSPRDPALRFVLAMQYQNAGDASSAINEYRKVVELAPSNAVALNNLAWLLFERRKPGSSLDEAIGIARRAQQAAPRSPQIMDTLGWILFQSGRSEEALPILRAAARLAPADRQIATHLEEASRAPAGRSTG